MSMNAPKSDRPDRIKRILLYGSLCLIVGTAQCGFFSTLSFLPVTPDLILGCLLAIALLDSDRVAMVASIAAGFFMDAIGGSGVALLPLVYFAVISLMSLLVSKMIARFLSFLVLMVPCALLRCAFTALQAVLWGGGFSILGAMLRSLLLEVVFTVLLCAPVYGLVKLARIPLIKKSKFSF